jgi:hypothetical protein
VPHQLEAGVIDEVRDVVLVAGEEIVDAEDVVALRQQAFAKMRTQEAGPSGDQDSFHSQMLLFRSHGLGSPAMRRGMAAFSG